MNIVIFNIHKNIIDFSLQKHVQMSNFKLLMDGQLALADLDDGGYFEKMPVAMVSLYRLTLPTTPRAEWDSWVKEKLMQTSNAAYWGFKPCIDY